MKFELNIKNIGKLEDAKIRIGRFTVLAGPNNTGKSYVSKLLYSTLNITNINPVEVQLANLTDQFFGILDFLTMPSSHLDDLFSPLREQAEELHNMVMDHPAGDVENLNDILSTLADRVSKIRANFPDIQAIAKNLENEGKEKRRPKLMYGTSRRVTELEQILIKLEGYLDNVNSEEFFNAGAERKVIENIISNFQVSRISYLKGSSIKRSLFEIDNVGSLKFFDRDAEFEMKHDGFHFLQQFSNVIYLESPIYWKLKYALERIRFRLRHRSFARRRLSGVPEYYYDLMDALRDEYIGEPDFPDLYENLVGQDVIGGKINISEKGDLTFQENNQSHPLPVTAMGVANLGMLALLIERNVVNKNSFVFVDEPEAHLHPAWEVRMAETLFELAKGGVHVVVATHSAEILKWLEVHVKNHPEDEKLVALNKFPVGVEDDDDQDFDLKMANIKKELTKPFSDLYMKGLL